MRLPGFSPREIAVDLEFPLPAAPALAGASRRLHQPMAIITRKNSFSGVKYSEEPAIFAWELMNEPRCEANSSAFVLEEWITEMAAFCQKFGLEGFYGMKTFEKSPVNPGEWAASLGTGH